MHDVDIKAHLHLRVFQKKRCKTKAGERVETLRASATAPNGLLKLNGESSPPLQFLPSTCNGYTSTCSSRDCASEGSSESSVSTLSEESFGSAPSVNGHELVLYNGEPPPACPPAKSRTEKKRRRSRQGEQDSMLSASLPLPALEELIKGKTELGVASFGRTAVTGRV